MVLSHRIFLNSHQRCIFLCRPESCNSKSQGAMNLELAKTMVFAGPSSPSTFGIGRRWAGVVRYPRKKRNTWTAMTLIKRGSKFKIGKQKTSWNPNLPGFFLLRVNCHGVFWGAEETKVSKYMWKTKTTELEIEGFKIQLRHPLHLGRSYHP